MEMDEVNGSRVNVEFAGVEFRLGLINNIFIRRLIDFLLIVL